jgi:hypothetical protein
MKMTLFRVPKPEDFVTKVESVNNLIVAMMVMEICVAVGDEGKCFLFSFYDSANTYCIIIVRWHIPCCVEYPKYSSSF